ncbi:spermatogenesis-associated protein 31D4-like [Acinonyx jubatus]|uniref:Spermatogenesis-associated protein 31D4-like n=1 Tax=Acinonyx jubatus TaxID=32536 RepID=A0ABM3NP48_ACIJB|nr:spermatogenesis-associated protein 31D4-like [Acinonyx jubatus]XP_053061198.1 spermatogenesis-associated protein 31D4-like [Acinonyx jubatus]
MLCFGSTCFETDPNFTFLYGLGLLLLFLCYLMGIPFPTGNTKPIQKHQGRAKRRRKGSTLKGWKCLQREEEEIRKLMSNIRSPLGRQRDTIYFRQLLCPDPFCEVCNNTTAEINRMLYPEALEDATSLGSTAPVTDSLFTSSPAFSADPPGDLTSASLPEPSLPLASTFPPNPMTPLADYVPLSPPDHSLPPQPCPPLESDFPEDHFPAQPLAVSPLPPCDAQTVDPVVQPEAKLSLNTIFSLESTVSQDVNSLSELPQTKNPTETCACHHAPPTLSVSPPPDSTLTVAQSKSISITLKPVPENSSPDGPVGLSTHIPTTTGIDHASLGVSDFSWWKTHAKDFFPSSLAQCDFSQEILALRSEDSSRGDPVAYVVEPGNLSFLSPKVLALLEKQVQKRSDFLIWKGKKGSFPKQLRPDYTLNSLGKMSESVAAQPGLAASLPFWNSKDKSKELHVHQQPPYPTTLVEVHLQQTPLQLFWGLPTLHTESLPSVAHVSEDCSSTFIFNRISTSTDQESPGLPPPLPQALPEIQPQSLPQPQPEPQPQPQPEPQPQPQPLPPTQVQPETYLQSPLPILPSSPLPQIKSCGVCFHRPQNELESLIPSEIQDLEWNVLQKQQASLWGLPAVVQRSHEAFCPSAPNLSNRRAFQAHGAVSILPGQFPLSDELRKKLEHHLRKRLIQHRWGLPRRIHESLSLMRPPKNFSNIPEMGHYHRLQQTSKSQSSNTLNVGLSPPESFHEGHSEMLQLEDPFGKDLGNNPENGPKDHLLSDPESSSDKDKGYDAEEELMSPSETTSRASVERLGQRQLENVLRIHLSKKLEEINEGQLPGTVHSSWHTVNETLLHPEKSNTEIQQRVLPPSVGGEYCLNTSRELSFIESNAQQMLESHIKQFHHRMLGGVPPKDLESIAIFKLKEAPSQSLSHSNLPCSTNLISEANSKSGDFKSLRGSSKSLHGDKVGTANSAPILDHSLPTTSTVGKEGQGIPAKSPRPIKHGLAEEVQKMKDGRQTLQPIRHSSIGKASQTQTVPANRWPSKQPARQAGTRREPKDKTINPSDRVKMQQGKMVVNPEPVSVPKVSRPEELDGRQSIPRDSLTTSQPGSPQMINVNANKDKSTMTIKSHPPNTSIPQDPNLTEWLCKELKLKLEHREQSWAQSKDNDLPPSTSKASLTHDQEDSSGDMGASQVLHVHVQDTGISTEQQQDTWVPKHVLRKHQHKNLPPATETVSPPCSKAQEFGGGDAGLGTSQPIRKSCPPRDVALAEKPGSQSSRTLSQKGQPPPESLFRKKVKAILQWLNPGRKCKRQENSQEKGILPCVQSRGMVQGRAAFTGRTEAQKLRKDVGKFLEEKMGHRHATDSACPQQPLLSSAKFGKPRKEAQVQAQAQPAQGPPLSYRAPSCKERNTKSCYQEAVFVGHSHSPSIRQIRDKGRHRQEPVLCQNHRPSVPHREPVPHPHCTCRHQAGQGPPATLTTAKGMVFGDRCLSLRQKTLLQNFERGKFPSPNPTK